MQRIQSSIDKLSTNFETLWLLDVLYKTHIQVLEPEVCMTPTACAAVKDLSVAIFFNRKFLDHIEKDKSVDGLVLHEVLHLTLYHHVRQPKGNNHTIWNAACDLEVNSIIKRLGIKVPDGALLPDQFKLPSDLSAEMYYDAIMQDEDLKKQMQSMGGKGKKKLKIKVGGDGQGQGQGQDQQDQNINPEDFDEVEVEITLDDHSQWAKDENEAKLQKTITDEIMKHVVKDNMSDIMKSKLKENLEEAIRQSGKLSDKKTYCRHGNELGNFVASITATGEGKMKWRYIMNQLIKKTLSKQFIPSFKRTSRRYGELVKGKIRNPHLDNIIIAVDTSGSINRELHERFLNEIILIRKMFKIDIRYIQCDTDIHMDKKIKRNTDMSKIKILGCGGTDFRPVFEHIKKKHYKPNLLLYFTDGCGDYPKKSEIPTLWVLDDDTYCREDSCYKPPFGTTIFLNEEKNK